jgi:AcrR family transcriptional regulator
MRTLAGRLGVRASSLYRHFPDRSSIEKTLALKAAEQLLDRMRQAVQGLNGERAVLAAAGAYLDYAVTEAAFYDMMMQSVTTHLPLSETTRQIWEFFVRHVSETTKLGDDKAGAAALWSFLHGFTALIRSGQMAEMSIKLTFDRGLQALVRGLCAAETEALSSTA